MDAGLGQGGGWVAAGSPARACFAGSRAAGCRPRWAFIVCRMQHVQIVQVTKRPCVASLPVHWVCVAHLLHSQPAWGSCATRHAKLLQRGAGSCSADRRRRAGAGPPAGQFRRRGHVCPCRHLQLGHRYPEGPGGSRPAQGGGKGSLSECLQGVSGTGMFWSWMQRAFRAHVWCCLQFWAGLQAALYKTWNAAAVRDQSQEHSLDTACQLAPCCHVTPTPEPR